MTLMLLWLHGIVDGVFTTFVKVKKFKSVLVCVNILQFPVVVGDFTPV